MVHTHSGCDLLLNSLKSGKFTLSRIPLKSHSQYTIRTRTLKSGRRKKLHCLIWAIGMLPPKLRHIFGCFATKKNCKKVTLPWSNYIKKKQWNGSFFQRHFLRQNVPFFFVNSNYKSNLKTGFWINFESRDLPKLENLPFHAFSVWGTSGGPKLFPQAVFK